MNDLVNNWLLLTRRMAHIKDQANKHILSFSRSRCQMRCKSGLILSIQASSTHYCSPRNDEGPWTQVEVMLIKKTPKSKLTKKFRSYAEDGTLKENGVLGFVPIELVNQVIENNGGVDLTKK